MIIIYRDELGFVEEEIDEYGVNFCDGKAYFNDKVVPVTLLESITDKN